MTERLTVDEAAAAYARAMRNPVSGAGACALCRTFVAPSYSRCLVCARQPERLDIVVPISYSEDGGALHHALWSYKNGVGRVQDFCMPRLAGILWRFLERHESCVANAAGVESFDVVTTVPSSSPDRDEQRGNLRRIVSWCEPIASRFSRALRSTGAAEPGRAYDPSRYIADRTVDEKSVLLIDDTWAGGGHAQSAADALKHEGARSVALVVIGRHVQPAWETVPGVTNAENLGALPAIFDWATCVVQR